MSSVESLPLEDAPPTSANKEDDSPQFKDPDEKREFEIRQRYEKLSILERYSMELIFMFAMFTFMVMIVPRTDIFMKKSCQLTLHLNESICKNITDEKNAPYMLQIERITKNVDLYRDIVSALTGAFPSLVAGQYMTRYGARTPLIIALCGSMISCLAEMYTFVNPNISLYYNILTTIPQAVTGGMLVFMTAVFSNVTLTCPAEARKKRFLMVQFFMFSPVLVAMAAGGVVYQNKGLMPLFISVCICSVLALILLLFVYPDRPDISGNARKDTFLQALKHSSSLKTFKKSLFFLTRERPGHARAQVYCMFGCLMSGVMAFSGTGNLNQIYMNHLFKWDAQKFSLISSITMVTSFVLTLPLMFIFSKILKLSDPCIILIGFASLIAKNVVMGFMFLGDYLYFIQPIVGLPFLLGLTAIRSHTSRLLQHHEVEVIFSLTSVCEKLTPVIADVICTAIYNATNAFFAGLVFFAQAGIFIIPLVLAILCVHWTRREGLPEYEQLIENSEEPIEKQ